MEPLDFKHDDGGRSKAGFKGSAGDYVCRSITITSGLSYQTVYDKLSNFQKNFLCTRRSDKWSYKKTTARDGIYKQVYKKYITQELKGEWIPPMKIGTRCQVHLRADELYKGRLIARISKHLVAVIDHVIHDTHNPSRWHKMCLWLLRSLSAFKII